MAVSVRPVPQTLCAEASNASEEPLAATASRVDHWLLVEYRGLWDRDVLGGSLLSERLKRHLSDQLSRLPHSRLLFIKKPELRRRGRGLVFFGSSRPGEERFFELEFERHEDLTSLDFAAALRGGETPGLPVEHPLFVVCTHGKRDRCCAKFGRPLYEQFCAEADPRYVWQSTHVGGDRFAGNVVCLPHGLYYGRVEEGDVSPLLQAYDAGEVWLDGYRGRAGYTFAVQAAERVVREETGTLAVDGLEVVGVRARPDQGWTVSLRAAGRTHEVDVVADRAKEAVYLTCGSVTPQHARRYLATEHRTRRGRG